MKKILLMLIPLYFFLISCGEFVEPPTYYLSRITPNPVKIGDTLTVFFGLYQNQQGVQSLEDIRLLLYNKENRLFIKPSGFGYYGSDDYNRILGNFHHTNVIDSLLKIYSWAFQCVIDDKYPSKSKVGAIIEGDIYRTRVPFQLIVNK